MNSNIHHFFWGLWEDLIKHYPKIADEYCKDEEYHFYGFRNEIQAKTDVEIAELILEIYKQIEQ